MNVVFISNTKYLRTRTILNQGTQIEVRLPGIGLSDREDVGASVGQGTIGGAIVSQAVLDDGATEHFPPVSDLHLQYGSVPMAPFMFQDDLVNGTEGLEQARETNRKVNCLVKERGLQLNKDKSVRKQVKSDPLMCGNFETKEVQVEKWLGQMFSAQGLADSVAKTVTVCSGPDRQNKSDVFRNNTNSE